MKILITKCDFDKSLEGKVLEVKNITKSKKKKTIRELIEDLSDKIDCVEQNLNARIDCVEQNLSKRIEIIEDKLVRNNIN